MPSRRLLFMAATVAVLGVLGLLRPKRAEATSMTCLQPGQYLCFSQCPTVDYCSSCPQGEQMLCEEELGWDGPCAQWEFMVICNYQS